MNDQNGNRTGTDENRYEQLQELAKSTFWGYLGCELVEATEKSVIISLKLADHHKNLLGIVHGGVMMSMLDNAMGLIIMLGTGENTVTATMNTHFLSNVSSGKIYCKAELLHCTKRTNTITASVYDEQDELLAWASGAYRLMK